MRGETKESVLSTVIIGAVCLILGFMMGSCWSIEWDRNNDTFHTIHFPKFDLLHPTPSLSTSTQLNSFQSVRATWDATSHSINLPPNHSASAQLFPPFSPADLRNRSLVVFGDSQAQRLTKAIVESVNAQLGPSAACVRSRKEAMSNSGVHSFDPDPTYYGLEEMVTSTRDCATCFSEMNRCGDQVLSVEYLSQEYIHDAEITTHRQILLSHSCNLMAGKVGMCPHAPTTQEFYLTEYLPAAYSRGCPDVVVVYASHAHDLTRGDLTTFERNFQWYANLLNVTVAAYSRLIYIPAPHVDESRIPNRFSQLTRDKTVVEMNQIAFRILRPYVESGRIEIFPLDIGQISAPALSCHTDAVHMTGEWYKELSHLILAFAFR